MSVHVDVWWRYQQTYSKRASNGKLLTLQRLQPCGRARPTLPSITGSTSASSRLCAPASRSLLRRLLSRALGIGLIAYVAFAVFVLVARYLLLPHVDEYRGRIEQSLGQALKRQVSLEAIRADWRGLHPKFELRGVSLLDASGRPALRLDRVDAEIGFSSLFSGRVTLHRLDIDAPRLVIRRDAQGGLHVAGLDVDLQGERGGALDWLLDQHQINVRDASLEWVDEQRGAAPLKLDHVTFRLDNRWDTHRFGLLAQPPVALARRIELRGEIELPDRERLASSSGQLYAVLDEADLAVWQQWVDYPVDLPRGQGQARLWADFSGPSVSNVVGDFALTDVALRLSGELPQLDLNWLRGRVSAARLDSARIDASVSRFELHARDGLRLPPTDIELQWQAASAESAERGTLKAGGLDLAVLAQLAAYLPLEAPLRERIARLAPRGMLHSLSGGWRGRLIQPAGFDIDARFEGLGLQPDGTSPGFSRLSGSVKGDERQGRFVLAAPGAEFQLPAVFPEPRLAFDRFDLQGGWRRGDGDAALQIDLDRLEFANADTAGQVRGSYVPAVAGKGRIDLQARLGQTDARVVWRYLPFVVNEDTRTWLRAALLGGYASEATLRLKGDLDRFPFRNGRDGQFQVKVAAHDVSLAYGASWPGITKLRADLLFDGERMLITGHEGAILNTRLGKVAVEIADLEAPEELLSIQGNVGGPTAEFLRFIEYSPVAERIDRFTSGMKAEGNGQLAIKILLPLRRLNDSRVEGSYVFSANQVSVDSAVPTLTDAAGRVQFTDSSLSLRNGQASMLGFPMSINVAVGAGGVVNVEAQGRAAMQALRQQFDLPLLDHLSGTTPWRAQISARKNGAELLLESSLVGVSSSLPAPFNKPASEEWPLRIERIDRNEAGEAARRGVPVLRNGQDFVRVNLARVLQAELIRRNEAGRMAIERGAVGVPRMPAMPERGVAIDMAVERFDAEPWRALLPASGGSADTPAPMPLARFNLSAGRLRAFGRELDQVRVDVAPKGKDEWVIDLVSQQARGKLSWNGLEQGRLYARFEHLQIDDNGDDSPQAEDEADTLEELPALDVEAGNFVLGGKSLGKLVLNASNQRGSWIIERLGLNSREGSLEARGAWARRPGARLRETRLDFKLESEDAGRLLDKLGYAGTLRRGDATLQGGLSWQGSPLSLHFASLDGNLELKATRGQFSKINPGAGRLLGVLSLQSLPRRITLDFRDVFSEGFAFDSIEGKVTVKHGILHTDDLSIKGPAARVMISGDADLVKETQTLKVRVQPQLGESVAVGALIANPAVGVATYLAQKVLNDPLDQIFAYAYSVTGSWEDPQVAKLSAPAPRRSVGVGNEAKQD